MSTYNVKLEEDENGDLILPLNSDIMAQMGWDIGDELVWEESFNNTWTIRKKNDESD